MIPRHTLDWFNVIRKTHRAAELYDLIQSPDLLLDETGTLLTNMGYWHGPDPVKTLAEANTRLFEEVIRAAGLKPVDDVLDVGCGTGGALQVAGNATTGRLCGLNASQYQLDKARQAFAASAWGDRLTWTQGDACCLPFRDAEYDVVMSVEAAFHFSPRTRFFHEAHRVLVPDGRIALADLVPPPPRTALEALNARALRRGLQIPQESFGTVEQYARELHDAGFVDVEVRDITDAVVPHHRRWIRSQPLVKQAAWAWVGLCLTCGFFQYPWRYVIATGRKP